MVLDNGERLHARATVLSTGGAAALWARTTNPAGAVGGGLLLAYAAGAALADIEMMQFHPTAVVVDGGSGDGLLVTEAIRGEGARLLNHDGERFVDELAPRDEVARAIYAEIAQPTRLRGGRARHARGRPGAVPERDRRPARVGIDPERSVIPVAPAAHYMMGGIETDLHARSTVPGLFAVGECSCTGLHGANRLASNSLSECFVFGARAARAALDEPALLDADAGVSTSSGRDRRSGNPDSASPAPASGDPTPQQSRRAAVALCGPRARRRRAERAARRPASAGAPDRDGRARAQREPRSALAAWISRDAIPPSTSAT